MKNEKIKRLTLSGMFLALGIVLPMLTGQIPQIGSMLLPMHIPVFLCALVCGWQYATPLAFILPFLRTLLFGVPNLYPEAIAIAFEMSTYALVTGVIYDKSKYHCLRALYRSLICSMVVGRVVRTVVQILLLGIAQTPFTFGGFFTAVIIRGIPGIILQLILIPAIMVLCRKTKVKLYIKKKTK